MNQDRPNTVKRENPTFEFVYFRLDSSVKIKIEIPNHVED